MKPQQQIHSLWMRIVRFLMPKSPFIPSEDFSQKVVKLFSRGNVNLQIGRYATRKQLDKRWESINKTDFSSL